MNENLPTEVKDFNSANAAMIMEMTGQGKVFVDRLSDVRVNYEDVWVDEDNPSAKDITLTRGDFKVSFRTDPEDAGTNVTAYASKISFRPFLQTYRYSVYDSNLEKNILSTTLFKNWNSSIVYDTRGNELSAKEYKKKTLLRYPQFEDQNTKLKCNRVLYGQLTMVDAKDMHGNDVVVENLPCQFYLKGKNFMPTGDIIDGLTKRQMLMMNYQISITTERHKTGAVTWFLLLPELVDGTITFTDNDLELLKQFQVVINDDNDQIIESYTKARAKAQSDDFAEDFQRPLEDDFIDVTPNVSEDDATSGDMSDPLPQTMS